MPGETFEVTTKIGCSVNCMKYCPQEIITQRYTGEKILHYESFKNLIKTIPSEIPIIFAGVSEPFGNPKTPDMIRYSNDKGHPIVIFSTLQGLSLWDAERIRRIPYREFIVHLPDAEGIAHIQTIPEWFEILSKMMKSVKNIRFMNMAGCFKSDGHEEYFRGKPVNRKKGKVTCFRHQSPNYIMMPNGDVYFCCQTKGLTGKVGSLNENTYPELVNKFETVSRNLQTDPESICHYCTISEKYWIYSYAIPIFEKLRGLRKRLQK